MSPSTSGRRDASAHFVRSLFAFNELNYSGSPEALSASLRRNATGAALKRGFSSIKRGVGGGAVGSTGPDSIMNGMILSQLSLMKEAAAERRKLPVSTGSENIKRCGNQNTDNVGEGPLTVIN